MLASARNDSGATQWTARNFLLTFPSYVFFLSLFLNKVLFSDFICAVYICIFLRNLGHVAFICFYVELMFFLLLFISYLNSA